MQRTWQGSCMGGSGTRPRTPDSLDTHSAFPVTVLLTVLQTTSKTLPLAPSAQAVSFSKHGLQKAPWICHNT